MLQRPSPPEDRPYPTALLWRTAHATPESGQEPAVSPLIAYPFVLARVLKTLHAQDIGSLLRTGNSALSALIHRHTTKLRFTSSCVFVQSFEQAPLWQNPFVPASRFPHLTTFTFSSLRWQVSPCETSPVYLLPKTLLHLTIASRESNPLGASFFQRY